MQSSLRDSCIACFAVADRSRESVSPVQWFDFSLGEFGSKAHVSWAVQMADALIPPHLQPAARARRGHRWRLSRGEPRRFTSQSAVQYMSCAPTQLAIGYSLRRSIANTLNRTWPPPIAHWPHMRRVQPAVHSSQYNSADEYCGAGELITEVSSAQVSRNEHDSWRIMVPSAQTITKKFKYMYGNKYTFALSLSRTVLKADH